MRSVAGGDGRTEGHLVKIRYTRAFSTLGCPAYGLPEVLALAGRHGIEGVELRALAGSTDLPAYFSRVESTGMPLAELPAKSGVHLRSLNSSFSLIGSGEADWDSLTLFGRWAERLGVPWVRVFDGGEPAGETQLPIAWAAVHRWRELRRRFRWKTRLLVETHGLLVTTPLILRFLENAPEVGLLWDSHYTWRAGEDPSETWRKIGQRVVQIHVKDSVAGGKSSVDFRYVLPGAGEFPMKGLRLLLEREFSGAVTLEWEKLWHPEIPSLDVALTAAREGNWW